MNRRELLTRSAAAVVGAAVGTPGAHGQGQPAAVTSAPARQRQFRLGMVTYNFASDWDLNTIIARCRSAGFAAVELRTTHRHGVEPTLSKAERAEVKKRCADGGLVILGLGSTAEYHSPDPAVVRKNIEDTKRFIDLARDLGVRQVKVRPNGLPKEVSEEQTLEQIGRSLREVGQAAAGAGVEICCEVHGPGTSHPPRMRKIMQIADLPCVGITWNSNPTDIKDGSIKEYFLSLRRWLFNVHINELIGDYPWRELFALLIETGYARYTMMETQKLQSADPQDQIRFMRYYRVLWENLTR